MELKILAMLQAHQFMVEMKIFHFLKKTMLTILFLYMQQQKTNELVAFTYSHLYKISTTG